MEQGTGIEPAFTAWEAVVLPIYEPCVAVGIIAERNGKFNTFLSALFAALLSEMHIRSKAGREIFRFSRRGLFRINRRGRKTGNQVRIFHKFPGCWDLNIWLL